MNGGSNHVKRNILHKMKNLLDKMSWVAGLSRFYPGTHGAESCNRAALVLGLFARLKHLLTNGGSVSASSPHRWQDHTRHKKKESRGIHSPDSLKVCQQQACITLQVTFPRFDMQPLTPKNRVRRWLQLLPDKGSHNLGRELHHRQ